MAKKKTTAKKPVFSIEAYLEKRNPSARSQSKCVGCFSPRNTLTVKPHLHKVWDRIHVEHTEKGAFLPCFLCHERRFLSLSSFSLDCLIADLQDGKHSLFVLGKDDKYNSLVGIEVDEQEREQLSEITYSPGTE